MASLGVDNSTIYLDNLILFTESDFHQKFLLVSTYEAKTFPIKWAHKTAKFINILHACFFCLFPDIICIFADDFSDA